MIQNLDVFLWNRKVGILVAYILKTAGIMGEEIEKIV